MKKGLWPIHINCQAENIVYSDTITCNEQTHYNNIDIGKAETTFWKDIVIIEGLLIYQRIRTIITFEKILEKKSRVP